jgi:histidinol-phosphatase
MHRIMPLRLCLDKAENNPYNKPMTLTENLSKLHQLADEADKIARHYFGQSKLDVQEKSDQSPVSQADLDIETMIRKQSTSLFPNLAILGEEFGACDPSAPLKLIIDPIDGTRNFVRGLPWFATLLAVEENGVITAGLVSSPITQERWWAQKNNGAFMSSAFVSHKRLNVSSISEWNEAQVFHGSLYGSEAALTPPSLLKVLSLSARQRGVGDYLAHMLVAMGCGECALDFGLKAWDIAPLKIIGEEAGGTVTNADGGFSLYTPSLISTNGHFHAQILEEMARKS